MTMNECIHGTDKKNLMTRLWMIYPRPSVKSLWLNDDPILKKTCMKKSTDEINYFE